MISSTLMEKFKDAERISPDIRPNLEFEILFLKPTIKEWLLNSVSK